MSTRIRETILLVLAVAGGLLLLYWASRPRHDLTPSPANALAEDVIESPVEESPVRGPGGDVSFSFDGHTFTVPREGDPEWEDYQEMLQDPRVRTSVQNAPGYQVPYDPEWRSMITGHRQVEPMDFPLVGYSERIEDLAQEFLNAIRDVRPEIMAEMRVDKEEWQTVFWPEFPQSRPYLKMPADEVWAFHDAEARSGANKALRALAGRPLLLESIAHGEREVFTNFSLLPDVRIRALDEETGEYVELDYLSVIAERQGRFKAYIFNE